MGRVQDKVALVTGGASGIGFAAAKLFVEEGATVVVADRDATASAAAVAELGQRACFHRLDVTREDEWVAITDAVAHDFGRIDILVNNAGVVSRTDEWTLSPDEWDRVHDVNLRATFFVARDCAIAMKKNGGGSILNVSSIAGQHGGIAGSPAYASSKAAVIGLTKSLARRFAPHAIRVNCLAPADIETDMTAGWPQELCDRLNSLTPLNRFGSVDEVAGAAVFLASDEASYITGQTLSINGGAFMG
jgi:NAD(P)-dependent dehydrogenase (short-subunit alcohol dehydrogenase family)